MNQESTPAFQKAKAKTEAIPFSELPGQSTLFLDYQVGSQLIDNYYPEKHRPVKDYADKVLANYTVDRQLLCDVLVATNKEHGAKIKTFLNIELLRQKDCVAVVTSRPAGLFSGALSTVYKVLAAIKMARKLRDEGIKAVSILWIAEEDRDFDEVKKTFIIDKQGDLVEIENTPKNYAENLPIGMVRLDETIEATIAELFLKLQITEFTEDLEKMLSSCFTAGESYSSAFAKFLMRTFSEYGLILVSPLDKKLKELSSPLMIKAVEKSDELNSALLQIGQNLSGDGYHTQVSVEENSFPFFLRNEHGERRTLRKDPVTGSFGVHGSTTEFERQELVEIARDKPHFLSPNALLRPIVQDFLLPTVAYFGGSAEIAYFAQNAVIYEILGRPVTPIRHRSSFTIIEASHQQTLEHYQLHFRDLPSGQKRVLAKIVERVLAGDAAKSFTEVETAVELQLNRLAGHLPDAGPTTGVLAKQRKKILRHLRKLRKAYHGAEIVKDEAVERRIEVLYTSFFPRNALQENSLNLLMFLNLYGTYFVESLYDAIETDEKRHQLLYI